MAKIVSDYDIARLDAAREIADLVGTTAGPWGNNVHFFQEYPLMYRDGFKVLDKYNPDDKLKMGVKLLMRDAAQRTVRSAGDGSTTTTLLLASIYEEAMGWIVNSKESDIPVSRRAIANGIRAAGKFCVDRLTKADKLDISTKKGQKLLRAVATLAGSNDEVVGNAVADIILGVGTDGHVVTEFDPKATEVTTEFRPGYRFSAGLLHPSMLPQGRASVTVNNAFVAMVKDSINKNEDLVPTIIKHWRMYCGAEGEVVPLVLICAGIDADARATMLHRRDDKGNFLPFYTITIQGSAEVWEDLEAITGVKAISSREGRGLQYFTAKHAAIVPSILMSMTETVIDIKKEALDASGLVGRLKEVAEKDNDPESVLGRIARLEGRVGVIRLPLYSNTKKSWVSEVFEDSYLASVSAVKHGICPGAGKQLCLLSHEIAESDLHKSASASFDAGVDAVQSALSVITWTLLQNGGVMDHVIDAIIQKFTLSGEKWDTIPLTNETLEALNGDTWAHLYSDGRETGVIDSAEALKAAILSATDEAADWVETSKSSSVMMYEASKAVPLKGRLLVDVIKSTSVSSEFGIELATNRQDTVMAIVIKSSEEQIPAGSSIMYDRVHGKSITLLDAEGSPHEYKVVQVADVSLILLE